MKKAKWIYCLVAVALIAVALMGSGNDRLVTTWAGTQMESESSPTLDSTRFASPLSLPPGVFTYKALANLKQGSYELTLNYGAEGAGNTLLVRKYQAQETPLEAQVVFAEYTLEPSAETRGETFTFTLAEDMFNVEIVTTYAGEGEMWVQDILLLSAARIYYSDHILLVVGLLLAAVLGYWWLFIRRYALGQTLAARLRKLMPAFFVLCLALVLSAAYFFETIPGGHDLPFHLLRIDSIAEAFKSGQFPPRIHPQFFGQRGYAVGLFYPDLLLWPFALLRVFGVSLYGAYTSLCFSIHVATAAVAFVVGRRMFRTRWAAAVFCVLYTTAVYRVNNIHVRAAIGESLAMIFLPLVLYGVYEIFFGEPRRWGWLVAGFTGLIQSHALSVLMAGVFCVLFGLCFIVRLFREKSRLFSLLKCIGLTLLFNLFYLVTLLSSNNGSYLIGDYQPSISEYALQVGQLFQVIGRNGPAEPLGALGQDMLLSPGLPLLFCAAGMLAVLLFRRKKEGDRRLLGLGAVCLVLGVFSLLLCTDIVPWQLLERLPLVGRIVTQLQFPWRFLSLASVLLAACGGVLAALYRPAAKDLKLVLGGVLALCLFSPLTILDASMHYEVPENKEDYSYQKNGWVNSDTIYDAFYLYEGVDLSALNSGPPFLSAEGESVVFGERSQLGVTYRLSYTSDAVTSIDLPILWYPGYAASDQDGKELVNEQAPSGLVRVYPQAPGGQITLRYKGLWYYRVGDAISLAGVLGCAGWALWRKRRKKQTAPQPVSVNL